MKQNSKQTGLEVAVISMVGRFPGAKYIDEFWNNIKNGTESITFFTDEELEESGVKSELLENPDYVKARAEFQDKEYFDNSFFGYSPREAESIDPQIRVFHECCWEALEKAGYDPTSYYGSIGVYAGAADFFTWRTLEMIKSFTEGRQGFGASVFNNGLLFLSQSVSYKLDLTGPSLTLFTACSTSLVAVHLACRALITGECNMALAGGISITSNSKEGYLYQEGVILSPDGHCRTFDARAQGTVFGEGVGIVVLKCLKDAIADGDNIIAVIKGSSINNDGIDKSSFTAPSQKRIATVVKKALKISQVDPETITYVETHGTATPLGDPIEIGALTRTFNTEKKQYCRIGSVKSNVGHLDVAAGIAGFIKAVLALKHKLIPPSLHFETPNPKIDLENSPFMVNTQLFHWENNDGYPLRAGVNSSGFGGTNAFVILEEAPEIQSPPTSRERKILLLSAKTEAALNKATANLAEYLEMNPDINLADAAYTLQVGRKAFQYRRMLVCSHIKDAIDGLSTPGPGKMRTFLSKVENRDITFMFPGQGAQYVNMGLELYQTERVFREEMDRCFEILKPLVACDIKEVLYPSNRSYKSYKSHINQTEMAQPLIFTIEYALAKLLINRGIKPDALVGHSIGEYVAACLAGVFSLEDALAVVALRGKMMQQMPLGSMASVALSLKQLQPLLNEKLSVAAVNGPSHCVVSGPDEAFEAFELLLREKEYKSTRLHTSHAFHSMMMDPILEPFEQGVSKFRLNKPGIPLISNLTGNWLTNEDAVQPKYWANHLRKTVYFSDGIKKLLQKHHAVFVEVGPGGVLSKLVKQHPDRRTEHVVINLLRHPKEDVTDDYFLLGKIGMLWLHGINIDWAGFYVNEKRHRIPLPTYPFEGQSFHLEGNPFQIAAGVLSQESLFCEKPDINDWFYIPSWKRSLWPGTDTWKESAPPIWLVFIDECGLGLKLVKELVKKGKEVITVKVGPGFTRVNSHEYMINPAKDNNYKSLFKELTREANIPGHIVHLWGITDSRENKSDIDGIDRVLDRGFYSLLNIAQAVEKQKTIDDLQVMVVTNSMQEVIGEDRLYPLKAAVLGAVKGIPKECPNIRLRSIDVILPEAGSSREEKFIRQLLKEFITVSNEPAVAIRDNHRWVESWEPAPLENPGEKAPTLKEDGIYLITGGLGGIGFVLAKYLAGQVAPTLVLTGRSPFPSRDRWEQWSTHHDEDDNLSRKIRQVQELESLGARVSVFSVDITNPEQMQDLVNQVKKQFGEIDGIIHTAGVPDGILIQLRTREASERVLAPKVRGTLVLDTIFRDIELDFFILCSSLDAIMAAPGQLGYCAANIFLDAFARNRSHIRNKFTLSINWPRWKGVGMSLITEELSKNLTGEELQEGISPEQGAAVFSRLLRCTQPQVAVSNYDLQNQIEQSKNLNVASFMEAFEGTAGPGNINQRPDLGIEYVAPKNDIQQKLTHIWSELFGFEPVGIHDDFFHLGGDSLKALILLPKIHKELNVEVPIADLFNRSTIEELAEFITGNAEANPYSAIAPVEKRAYYAVSSAQKRLYILQRFEKNNVSYNQLNAAVLEGKPGKDRLEKTFKMLIQRHESLRTSFEMIESKPVQRIHDHLKFEIEWYDLANNEKKTAEPIIKNFLRPFDLSQPPLFRVGLIKSSGDATTHILVIDIHHIISDGTSTALFIKDFMSLYGVEELSSLRIQYKDFSGWQNSEEIKESIKKQESYWLKEFTDEIPVLNLLTDFPKPLIQSFAGSILSFEIEKGDTAALKRYALEQETTLFMVLLALYNIFLSKISIQEDIVVGTPSAGRPHADLENIMGMFVNTLALRNFPGGEKKVAQFLEEVKTRTLDAFSNQDYPYEELVEETSVVRDAGRNPLFDTMFILQNFDTPEVDIPGLNLKPYPYNQGTSRFDLTLQAIEMEETLSCTFEYCTKLFKVVTIERFINHFKKVISAVIETPAVKIMDIEIISEEEKKQILAEFNNTKAAYPEDKTIIELFEVQVEKTPDNTALIYTDQQVTYKVLDEMGDRIARVLPEKGIDTNCIVGLTVVRSIEMMVGIFSILKAGRAYIPIDPEYPPERINYMLADSEAKLLVTTTTLAEKDEKVKMDTWEGEKIFLEEHLAACNYKPETINRQPVNCSQQRAKSVAYVIYTSGSTGKPKGVIIEHGSLVNRLNWMQKSYLINTNDTLLQKTPFTFDVSVWEIFWWSLIGAKLCLLVPGGEKDPAIITHTVEKNHVTVMHFVPSMLNVFLEYLQSSGETQKLSCLKQVIASGEALTVHQVNSFNEVLCKDNSTRRNPKLDNLYGPTEATIDVSYFSCSTREPFEKIPIGKPIDNIHLYVTDETIRLQPVGVAGELCISGVGLARGYLNRPELTAEKFCLRRPGALFEKTAPGPRKNFLLKVSDKSYMQSCNHASMQYHSRPPHYPIYKTGDLARWLPDGNIEFLGRMDYQIKIRGFRIELGEIESQLGTHNEIKEAVVLAKVDGKGDRYLCAYFVSDTEIDMSDLREFLAVKLPDYMIPAYFVPLKSVPLTPNGKIDRKALPESGVGTGTAVYTAPRDTIEIQLVHIWSEVLEIEKVKISIDVNFFAIGGHSLKATVMASRTHKEFNVNLPLAQVFRTPTIRGLSGYIKGLNQDKYISLEPVEKKEYYPLSSAQERLYFLHGMDDQGITYNLPAPMILEGNPDENRLENTFKRLIQRHESLRTSFQRVEDEPVQKIHDPNEVGFSIEYYDMMEVEVKVEEDRSSDSEGIRGLAPLPVEPAVRSPHPAAALISSFIRPFDLSRVPLFRVGLLKEHEGKHILFFDMHHIASDGVSMGVIVNEFMKFYSGEEMPKPGIQYKDFSRWQKSKEVSESIKKQEAYWQKEFADEIPILHLANDFTRPRVQSFEGSTLDFEIEKENAGALKTYALKKETTLFTLLLAVYNIFLSKLSSQEDIVVGTPIAGRRHSDLQHTVGMFVNTLALRNFPGGEITFTQFLDDVKRRVLGAFSNQDYLYEDLVEKVGVTRDVGRNPLFDVMFMLQNFDIPDIDIPGLKLKSYNYKQTTSKFDLTLGCTELENTLLFTFEYSTKLFKTATIKGFINYFRKLISIVIENPGIKIADMEITSEKEKQKILYDFNDTAREYPGDKTIPRLFAEQAARAGDRTAIVFTRPGETSAGGNISVNYGELNNRTDKLAKVLRGKGVKPNTIVPIMTERSLEMIVGILGILKAGGAYLPIDPGYPEERKRYILADSNAKVLVSEVRGNIEVVDLDRIIEPIGNIFKDSPTQPAQPNHLAYVIYTSGTTGRPKGVVIEHKAIINTLFALHERYPFEECDVYLLKTSYVFDVSVAELFGWFLGGGSLAILEKNGEKDPRIILNTIKNLRVTHINFVPSMFNVFVTSLDTTNADRLSGLKYLFLAGEALLPGPVNTFRQFNRKCILENIYGPTEAAVYSSWYSLSQWESGGIPIGSPLDNVKLYILNKYDSLQPVQVAGELCISGVGLARGYLNRPGLTHEKFKHNFWDLQDYQDEKQKVPGKNYLHQSHHYPISPSPHSPIYRTGDLARWLPGGNIEFLGRIDNQVKMRGFRIELGEIENQLLAHEQIKETVVVAIVDEKDDKYLCAYIVSPAEPGVSELRRFLSVKLQDYMIPSHFVQIEKMPMTPTGKIDRKALPAPVLKTRKAHETPRNAIEVKLVDIWAEVLGIKKDVISINSNFFLLGGHSLRVNVMIARIQKELNVYIPLAKVFSAPTVREMAAWITAAGKTRFAPIPAVEKKEYYPLSHAQERVWIMSQLEEASIAFNISMALIVEGELNIPAFDRTFKALLERHESFRTTFFTIDGKPKQKILPPGNVDFQVNHLHLEGKREKEIKISEWVEQETVIPFDLTKGPLLRISLNRLEEKKHLFFFNMHHIISDFLSIEVFIKEMLLFYGAFLEGKANPLKPLTIQYKDYAQWHNKQLKEEQSNKLRQYWLSRLAGTLPRMELTLDKERPALQTYNGDELVLIFEEVFYEKLKAFSEVHDVTLFMTLLTALNILFFHYTGQTDIILGIIIAGREHANLEGQVGYYLNTLALRSRFDSRDAFTTVLKNVKTVLTEAYQHQAYPFDRLVEDLGGNPDRSRHPIFDVVVDMLNYTTDHEETLKQSESGIIQVENFDIRTTTTKFDFTIYFLEGPNKMNVRVEYNSDLFLSRTVELMMNRFRKLLDNVLEKPDSAVSALRLEQKVQAPMIQRISRRKSL